MRIWAILVVMLSIELASNTAQGPYQGLLPDMVPPGERGLASGFIGAGNLAGNVIGVALSGVALAVGDIPLAVIFSAGSLLMGTVITAATMHETEGRSGGGPARAVDWARELVHLSRWATPVRRIVLEVWGRDVLEQRDYLWLLASRLAILMAAGTLQPFAYYYLEDSLGLGANAGLAFAPLAGAVALVALVSAVPGGAMTARWARPNRCLKRSQRDDRRLAVRARAELCVAVRYRHPLRPGPGRVPRGRWALLTTSHRSTKRVGISGSPTR